MLLIGLMLVFSVNAYSQVQVDKFTGDASYGIPLITVPNFRGPSVTTSIMYKSDIKVDQAASEVGLGWDINAGGSVERSVNGIPDDWKNVDVPDMQTASFQQHLGALYFHEANDENNGNPGNALKPTLSPIVDFDYTRYKMDTLNDTARYYYPNYDSYYVTGGGMSGKITPNNYDFKTVMIGDSAIERKFYNERWRWIETPLPPSTEHWGFVVDSLSVEIREVEIFSFDYYDDFDFKTHFAYEHNRYSEVNSDHYPWSGSPIDENSYLPIPIVNGGDTYSGEGYNDENYPVSENRNRTRTSNYVEYFTNMELAVGVSDFMEYAALFDRSDDASFPEDGIGAYRITGPNGNVYHYSLPVYANYVTSGAAALDKYYQIKEPEGGITEVKDSTNGYVIENEQTTEIFEIKQTKKYAIRWLLTAITGPDFEDSNASGTVDLADKGYWVKYNYGLWTDDFASRYPYYGGNYSFSSSIDEKLWPKYMDDFDSTKITGKNLSYSETGNQLYYLNEIQTPSHTGIFVRDLRNDEQSMLNDFDYSEYRYTKDLRLEKQINYWSGKGTLTATEPANPFRHILSIKPEGVDSIALIVNVDNWIGDNSASVVVLDGDSLSSDTLLHYYLGCQCFSGGSLGRPADRIISSGNELTIVSYLNSSAGRIRYDINWSSKWKNKLAGWPAGKAKSVPQLKLSKMLLFDNNDLASLPTTNATYPEVNPTLWDYTTLNRYDIYSGNWYLANNTLLESLALQSVDLNQDYSLAKGYYNNRYTFIESQNKRTTAVAVENSKSIATNYYEESGKLTLNKITYFGLNKTQTQPSHIFDYNASSSIDNPEYNTLLQDYWGNYKSDAAGNLLRGYVTDVSVDGVDAWSLRKITSPLGGVTELIYESDEYEQVLSEEKAGELRGARKVFALKNVHSIDGNEGEGWTFDLENQSNYFWSELENLPAEASIHNVIPCVWVNAADSSYDGHYVLSSIDENSMLAGFAISYGDGVFSEVGSKLEHLNFYELNLGLPILPLDPTSNYYWKKSAINSLAYAGNGYASFKYPLGYKVKGGGTRVKEIKTSNTTDTYTIAYTYDQGTATSEAGDFSGQGKTKKDYWEFNYDWGLTSFSYNPFGLNPQVGYGKVTVENKGQLAVSEGQSLFYFQVSDEGKNNFEPYVVRKDTTWNQQAIEMKSIRYGVEIIDDFTSIWGKIKAQELKDVNGSMISRKVYEYEASNKGAEVHTMNYEVENEGTTGKDYVTCIRRTYPYYLKNVITYSNGRNSEAQVIDRDPFTGSSVKTKSTSVNGTESSQETSLAYTQSSTPNYSEFGAKSVDPSYQNFLNGVYAFKSDRGVDGVVSSDFSSYVKSFWKNTVNMRAYHLGGGYSNTEEPVEWFDYTKYTYVGALGAYGLFDNASFTDISAPPVGSSDWRFLSEVTLMDEEQNVLEQKGYNDRFSASKLGYDKRFTYTSASNSNYVSFTGSGFETLTRVVSNQFYFEGEVLASAGNLQLKSDLYGATPILPHTGNYMVKIPSSATWGPIYIVKYDQEEEMHSLQRGRTYSASVWVHEKSADNAKLVVSINGSVQGHLYNDYQSMAKNESTVKVGDWIQLSVSIAVPENYLSSEGTQNDLRVYLASASTTTASYFDDLQFKSNVSGSGMNVYDQRTGRVLATLSDNNFATKYVYSNTGQVIEVWKEVLGETWGKWVKVESKDFNFKRAME